MTEEEVLARCDEIYMQVRSGANLKDCMEMLGVHHGTNAQTAIRRMIWETCLHFLSGTSLPSLKGEKLVISCRNPAYSMCFGTHFAGETGQSIKAK